MALSPEQMAGTGALPGYNEQKMQYKQEMAKDLANSQAQQDLYGKIIDNEESRYDLAEKKDHRGQRDAESLSAIAKAKNAGYRFNSDTDQRKVMEAAQAAQVAEQTGSEEAWAAAEQAMTKAHPVYGKLIKDAKTPKQRQDVIRAIGEGTAHSLEVAQKGIQIGMSNKAALGQIAARGFEDRKTQEEKFEAMVEMASTEREFKADEGQAKRSHERDQASHRHKQISMIRSYAEATGDYQGANAMLEAAIKASIQKDVMSGMSGKSRVDIAGDKITQQQKVMEQVMKNQLSGTSLDLDTLPNVPGGKEMYNDIVRLVDAGQGNMATSYVQDRYLHVDDSIGIVKMPTDSNGLILGGRTALDILRAARQTGEDVETVLELWRRKLISQGEIESGDWDF